METPEEPLAELKKVICPIATVWNLFFINLIIIFNENLFKIYIKKEFYLILYLLITLYLLAIAIVITISIERIKYKLYFIGFIMSIIFEAIVTIYLFIKFINKSSNFVYYLILLLIEWTLFIVLISYRRRVLENSQNNEINQGIYIMTQGEDYLIQN